MSKNYSKHQLDWIRDARCAKDPDSVKDAYGDDFDPEELDHKDAQAFADYHCIQCPVMVKCLRHAVKSGETQGVWGGMLPEERVGLREGEGILG